MSIDGLKMAAPRISAIIPYILNQPLHEPIHISRQWDHTRRGSFRCQTTNTKRCWPTCRRGSILAARSRPRRVWTRTATTPAPCRRCPRYPSRGTTLMTPSGSPALRRLSAGRVCWGEQVNSDMWNKTPLILLSNICGGKVMVYSVVWNKQCPSEYNETKLSTVWDPSIEKTECTKSMLRWTSDMWNKTWFADRLLRQMKEWCSFLHHQWKHWGT